MEVGAGTLYVVATPIGNLEDITARAVRVLQEVDRIAAEDTRHSSRLLQHLGLATPMFSLHDYNEADRIGSVIEEITGGHNIALISDAGTPLISDPGFRLVRAAHAAGLRVVPLPGPSAVTAALSVAGLPTDRFCFEGFLPSRRGTRRNQLESLVRESRTLVFFEAPHRIVESLRDMESVFGVERQAVLCKELSKNFETVISGSLGELGHWLEEDENRQRGEFVVLLHGAETDVGKIDARTRHVLITLLAELPLNQACSLCSKITGQKKNSLYQLALQLKEGGGER